MNQISPGSHRGLFYVLFAIFEPLLLCSVVVLYSSDPRRRPILDAAAGVTSLFSVLALSILCWIFRRNAERLAALGLITVLVCIFALGLLPAVP